MGMPTSSVASNWLQIVPVYCFDPRHYGTTPWGVKKTGDYRAKFLLESVNDLKQNLQQVLSQHANDPSRSEQLAVPQAQLEVAFTVV